MEDNNDICFCVAGIRNTKTFARGLARRYARRPWVSRFLERGRLALAELVHEALVGIWLASQIKCPEGKDILGHYADVARSRMERFMRDQFGIWSGSPDREFQIPQNEDMEFAVRTRDEEIVLGGTILEIARGVLLAHPRGEQGQRDWRVLRLFLLSYSPSEVAKECPWLKNGQSASAAVDRIVRKLRQVFGGDLTKSLATHPSGLGNFRPRSAGAIRTRMKEYQSAYYCKNKDRLKARMRERMRAKRAAAKAAKAAKTAFGGSN